MLTQLKMLVGTSVKCLEHAWFIENGIRHEGAIKCVEGLIELNLALRAVNPARFRNSGLNASFSFRIGLKINISQPRK